MQCRYFLYNPHLRRWDEVSAVNVVAIHWAMDHTPHHYEGWKLATVHPRPHDTVKGGF